MESNVIFPELPTYTGVVSWGGFLSLLVTVALPVVAGLFMRTTWSTSAKGFVLLCCSAVKAFGEAWILAADAHTHFDAGRAGYATVVSFTLAVVAYFGLVKNMSIQQAAIRRGFVKSRVIDGTTVPPRRN